MRSFRAAFPGLFFLLIVASVLEGWSRGGATVSAEPQATVGFVRFRSGFFSAGPAATSPAGTWAQGRLHAGRASDATRIAAYARRYGISQGLSREIYEAAVAEQLSPALAFGLVKTESAFDPQAIGPTGSIGLTQLQPSTARHVAPRVSRGELFTPRVNLKIGFRYLRSLLDRFDNDVAVALAAYNGGPERVERQLTAGRTPARAYARKVLRHVEPGFAAAL